MKRIALIVVGVIVLAACPGDDDQPPVDPSTISQIDTTPVSFDSLETSLPPAVTDTQTPPPPVRRPPRPAAIPPAPPALVAAVSREQSFTKFCYQEFGQKADPTLRGGVAMVVTVNAEGISDARVENDSWTSDAGAAVNRCLNEKAKDAWRLGRGDVRPGKYVVNLTFTSA